MPDGRCADDFPSQPLLVPFARRRQGLDYAIQRHLREREKHPAVVFLRDRVLDRTNCAIEPVHFFGTKIEMLSDSIVMVMVSIAYSPFVSL
jgi:hypothetical protein